MVEVRRSVPHARQPLPLPINDGAAFDIGGIPSLTLQETVKLRLILGLRASIFVVGPTLQTANVPQLRT
jgi:hypothetical protein